MKVIGIFAFISYLLDCGATAGEIVGVFVTILFAVIGMTILLFYLFSRMYK